MDRADIEADDALNRSFTRQEIVLLARYSVAKAALQYLRPWFLVKYAVFVLVFILLVLADGDRFVQGVAGFLVVVGLMLLLGQSLIRRLLVRLGGFRRLARFDAIVDETWTGFRDEMDNVTGLTKPWSWIGTALRLVRTRDAADAEDAALRRFDRVDWTRLLAPLERVGEARAALADAAQRR